MQCAIFLSYAYNWGEVEAFDFLIQVCLTCFRSVRHMLNFHYIWYHCLCMRRNDTPLLTTVSLYVSCCHSGDSTSHISPSGWLWPETFTSAWFIAAAFSLVYQANTVSRSCTSLIMVRPACVDSVELPLPIVKTELIPFLILTRLSISFNLSIY